MVVFRLQTDERPIVKTIGLIGAPSSAGAYAPGQERTPEALRETGLLRDLADRGVDVHDRGDTPHWRWAPDRESPRAQNSAAVAGTIEAVAAEVGAALDDGELALVLGGDCTVGLGAVRALAAEPGYGLLYLDMHSDMNTPESTRDGALDWMGVAHLLGLDDTVPALVPAEPLLPAQLSLLGFEESQATAWEREQIAGLQIATTSAAALIANPGQAAQEALAALRPDCERIAVHFDVDVIDFVDAPLSQNTGRNVGVPLASALAALDTLLADPRVATVTVTELNPLHGAADGSTLTEFARGLAAAVTGWAGT
jgi:arginase